jgi:hypothetical protein
MRILKSIAPAPEFLQNFILSACWNDAGDSACRQYLGHGLGEIASSLLGQGDWGIQPELWYFNQIAANPKAELEDADDELEEEPDENGFLWPKGMKPT